MPLVDLTFPQEEPLNVSIQVTDIIYVAKLVNDQSGKNHITGIDTKPVAWPKLNIETIVDYQLRCLLQQPNLLKVVNNA